MPEVINMSDMPIEAIAQSYLPESLRDRSAYMDLLAVEMIIRLSSCKNLDGLEKHGAFILERIAKHSAEIGTGRLEILRNIGLLDTQANLRTRKKLKAQGHDQFAVTLGLIATATLSQREKINQG